MVEWWIVVLLLSFDYLKMNYENFEYFEFLLYEWYYLCLNYETLVFSFCEKQAVGIRGNLFSQEIPPPYRIILQIRCRSPSVR